MKKYNIQDVNLLEAVYTKLRPWILNHPYMRSLEMNFDIEIQSPCDVCGNKDFIRRGYIITLKNNLQRLKCRVCGKWTSMVVPKKLRVTE
jgi:hypothetical protein